MRVSPPQIAKELDKLEHLNKLMESDKTLTCAILRYEDISNIIIKSFNANEIRLEKVNATEAKLEKTGFSDVEILSCTLIASSLPESSWRRVFVKESRCSGLQLQTSTLKDVTFSDRKLNLANFRLSKLKDVHFKNCVLDEADFYAALLENVNFTNCSLIKTEFSTSKLMNVDLRTSDLSGILGIGSLAGATIDSIQLALLAPQLAYQLKLVVKDD